MHNFGVASGTEHDVNVLSDTMSNHMIISSSSVAVILLHNHPSTQTFFIGRCAVFCSAPYNSPSSEMYMATLTFLAKCSEAGLQKSIQKNKEMMAVVEEYKRKRAVANS